MSGQQKLHILAMISSLHRKTEVSLAGLFRLPVMAVQNPYGMSFTDRNTNIEKTYMRIIVYGMVNEGTPYAGLAFAYFDNTGIVNPCQSDIDMTSITSMAGLKVAAQAAIDAQTTSFGYTITDTFWLTNLLPTSKTFNYPSLAVNTSRQASTVQDALVSASVDITASLSLTTGQSGKVSLQYADNTGFSTNVVTVQPSTNGNTGTLAIGLALGQVVSATVSGIIPAGKFYRIVTTNITGTPTYGTPVIQEVLL